MIKLKNSGIKLSPAPGATAPTVAPPLAKERTTAGLCDKCHKRIKYVYVPAGSCWVVKCTCGHLNIVPA